MNKKLILISINLLMVITLLMAQEYTLDFINAEMNVTEQAAPQNNFANTNIEIDLTDSSTTYKRNTFAPLTGVFLPDFRTYLISADLTTHDELYIQFYIEWEAENFNNNFTNFANAPFIKEYNKSFEALRRLVKNQEVVDVLKISSRSFRLDSFQFLSFNEVSKTEFNVSVFVIEEKVVVKETTAFVLNLFEPFNFDLNGIEIGGLTNFKFESRYQLFDNEAANTANVEESLELTASGSFLESNVTSKGFDGELTFEFRPEPLGEYERDFVELPLPQIIDWTITVPSDQIVDKNSLQPDDGYNERTGSSEISALVKENEKNKLYLHFETGDWVPEWIKFSTSPPILELWQQISLSDYLSFVGSVFIALVTIVKGLPYYFSRRNTGGYKKKLHNAVLKNDWKDFEYIKQHALEKYLRGKLSLSQIQSILDHIKVIKENIETVNDVIENPQVKQIQES